jgi:translocation and assembly module TamB
VLLWSSVATAVFCLFALLGVMVLRSSWFRETVRVKIVETVETATGGKVEVGSFHYDWSSMRAGVTGFTLHGLESKERRPLFHADSILLAIHIRSLLGREVDLRELVIEKPELHIYVDEQGNTNFPGPKTEGPSRNVIQDLIRLKIQKTRLTNGLVEYDNRELPFAVVAENLSAAMSYAPASGGYALELGANKLRFPQFRDFAFQFGGTLKANQLDIEKAEFRLEKSRLALDGVLTGWKTVDVKAKYQGVVDLAEFPEWPLREGLAEVAGDASWNSENAGYRVGGHLIAKGLGVRQPEFTLAGARLTGDFVLQDNSLALSPFRLDALEGSLGGKAAVRDWNKFTVEAAVKDMSFAAALRTFSGDPLDWDGLVSGPVELTGRFGKDGVSDLTLTAEAAIEPKEGRLPAEGGARVRWSQATREVEIEDGVLQTPKSRIHADGTIGKRLQAALVTTDVNDLEPFIDLLAGTQNFEFPFHLEEGEARVDAVLRGPIDNPEIEARVAIRRPVVDGYRVESARADVSLSKSGMRLSGIDVVNRGDRVAGTVSVALSDWRITAESAIQGRLKAESPDVAGLMKLAGLEYPVAGSIRTDIDVRGVVDRPAVDLKFSGQNVRIGGETLSELSGELSSNAPGELELKGNAKVEGGQVRLSGSFRHPRGDWRNGELSLEIHEAGFELATSETAQQVWEKSGGEVRLDANLRAKLNDGELRVEGVDGSLAVDNLEHRGEKYGNLRVESKTQQGNTLLSLTGSVGGRPVRGTGKIGLSPGYPAAIELDTGRLPIALIADLTRSEPMPSEGLPVKGFVEAKVNWRGRLTEPKRGEGTLTIPAFQLRAKGSAVGDLESDPGDTSLRNATPVVVDFDTDTARIRTARFVAKDTSLTVNGVYSLGSKTPWDMSVNGSVNLAVADGLSPDLTSSGVARISANIRGEAANPRINGRMTVQNASFYLKGLANGLDRVNGVVLFSQNRANIQEFTGYSGGGKFQIGGFIGFEGSAPTFRLTANARDIRVRYPEGVSTVVDTDLELTGSTARMLLSGLLTLDRVSLNTETDLGSMITGSSNPIPVPATQNEFLRNLQFDVRVKTAPNATFQTQYTQDLQLASELRLRGSPAKPVLLGGVRVNQGEIQFFGNRYTISRGEVLFYNTATVQPSLNLDLETRIRGVTVYINLSGPLSRLNINYRSEPPLQSSEIIALLTVGRAPTSLSSSIPLNDPSRTSPLQGASSSALLGGAISSGASSFANRFFGVSRVKIDPNVTGVENIPQARLTLEQSISRDVTLTFSTNLSRTNQQIIRVEWDLSREWSVVAVRDESGAFGVDFFLRKRFK